MKLAEIQRSLLDTILGQAHYNSNNRQHGLEGLLTFPERFFVHRNGYAERLRLVIAEVYPKTLSLIGPDKVQTLTETYARTRFFTAYDLNEVCLAFADFLEQMGESAVIIDLARLEWACSLAFHAAETDVLEWQALLERMKASSGDLRIPIQAFVKVHVSRNPLFHFYSREKVEAESFDVDSYSHENLLIFRVNGNVRLELISDPQAYCLELLLSGLSLGEMCVKLEERAREVQCDESDVALHHWLFHWAELGLFCI